MAHVVEAAVSGRSKCRGCGGQIEKDTLRFGECIPNPFAEGETTLWFHLWCGACRRPEAFREVLEANPSLEDADAFSRLVQDGLDHPRLERLAGAERSPSGRAACRSCRKKIGKDEWRLVLQFFEEGSFNPAGYIHAGCAGEYFGTVEVMDRLRHLAPSLTEDELAALAGQLR